MHALSHCGKQYLPYSRKSDPTNPSADRFQYPVPDTESDPCWGCVVCLCYVVFQTQELQDIAAQLLTETCHGVENKKFGMERPNETFSLRGGGGGGGGVVSGSFDFKSAIATDEFFFGLRSISQKTS